MKNLKEVTSMEEVNNIIAEEEHDAATNPNYLPSIHLALLNVAEKASIYSILRDDFFLKKEKENIHLLNKRILSLYKKNGIKYREDMEGNHLSALRHMIKSADIDFDKAYDEAMKVMYELPDKIFTFTYLFQFLESKICAEQTQMSIDEFLK